MQRFTDLRVWEASHKLALEVYADTSGWPHEERLGLTAQLRRAVVSIAANIAEGSKRESRRDYARFLNMAEGSAAEAEEYLLLARDLTLLPETRAGMLVEQLDHVARMLARLRQEVLRRQRQSARGTTVPGTAPGRAGERSTLDAQRSTDREEL